MTDFERQSAASWFRVRPAAGGDYDAFAGLFPELNVGVPVPPRQEWESALAPCTWVAVVGEEVVGYCYSQEYEDTGYIRNVVVAPRARRRGVGRALMQVVAQQLRRSGKRSWRLNVRSDNQPALALYGRMGMNVQYLSISLRLPWKALASIPAGRAAAREFPPARDAIWEELFDLPRGQLSYARGLGRLLLEAVSGPSQQPEGVAVFDPGFPGAFPFRVVEIDAVAPLLHAIRAQVPTHEFVNLVTEDDARLAELLTSVGATVRDEILHLSGEL